MCHSLESFKCKKRCFRLYTQPNKLRTIHYEHSWQPWQALGIYGWTTLKYPGKFSTTLQWRHNEPNGVSNHHRLECLLNRLFRRIWKKTSKLHITGLCEGNLGVTSGFPSQRAIMQKMFPFDDIIMIIQCIIEILSKIIPLDACNYARTQSPLQWRHNGRDGVSTHQPHGCLLNRLFRCISKITSKLRVTGLCEGNSLGPVKSPHKLPVTRKMVPFDDIIMGYNYGCRSVEATVSVRPSTGTVPTAKIQICFLSSFFGHKFK